MSYSGGGGGGTNSNSSSDNNANLKVNNITSRDGKRGAEVTGIVEAKGTHFVPPSGRIGQRYVDGDENIVRDGLVFHLDAKYSYDGLWYDMSSSESHGNLINGAQYDSTAGGNILFDGSNDRVNLDVHGQKYATSLTSGYSFDLWIRFLSHPATGYNGFFGIGLRSDPGGGTKTLFNTFFNGSNRQFSFGSALVGSSGRAVNTNDPTICPLNEWLNYQGTIIPGDNDTSAMRLYKNGVQVQKVAPFTPSSNEGTSSLFDMTTELGSRTIHMSIGGDARYNDGTAQRHMNGNVAVAKLYNRELTAAEVLQNYDALKSRFGH